MGRQGASDVSGGNFKFHRLRIRPIKSDPEKSRPSSANRTPIFDDSSPHGSASQ